MKKYRLHSEDDQEKVPGDDVINKYKDFGKLTHNYDKVTKIPKKPLYKDPKAFIALVLVIVVVWLIFVMEEEEKEKQNTPAGVEQTEE